MAGADLAGARRGIVVGKLTGQPEIEGESQGEYVGTGITPASSEDLGRGVIPGSRDRTCGGDTQLTVEPGRSEIRQSVPAVGVEQDVLRLYVAVKDAMAVRGAERGGDVAAESNRLVSRQGAAFPPSSTKS